MTDQNKEPQERNEGTRSNALTRVLDIIGAYNSIAPEADEILQGSVTDAVIDATERPEQIEHLEEASRRLSHKTGQDFTAAPDHVEGGYTARLDRALRTVKNALDTFVKSEEWNRLKAEFPGLEDMDALFIAYMVEDLIEYAPEIKEILQGYREQGKDIDFRGLIYGEPPQDAGPEAFIDYVLNRAQEIRKKRRGGLPKETVQPVTKADYPLDKVNALIWSLLTEDQNGQLTFFAMESKKGRNKKKNQELNLTYTIDFNALEEEGAKVSKRLTPTDKRIYIAISALFNAGNTRVTTDQIYKAMGGTGKPSDSQRKRINESVYKMGRAWITINDAQEQAAYSYDIDEHRPDGKGWTGGIYDGPLLPMERGQAIINGKLADAAIHLFREPPLLTFAKLRHQLTTLDIKLLQSPISKTDGNLLIEDYLLTRIAKAKNTKGKRAEKILFKTLFEKTGITDKKQKQRTPAKVENYLKFYKEQYFINHYKIESDSVTVYF